MLDVMNSNKTKERAVKVTDSHHRMLKRLSADLDIPIVKIMTMVINVAESNGVFEEMRKQY